MPRLALLLVRTRGIVAVERELRLAQLLHQPAFLSDTMKNLDCRIDDGVTAIHDALQNDLEYLARRNVDIQCGLYRVLERRMAPGHRVLAREHKKTCAQIQRRPLTDSRDRKIEPELREVLIEAVAVLDSAAERIRLNRMPGFEYARTILRRK